MLFFRKNNIKDYPTSITKPNGGKATPRATTANTITNPIRSPIRLANELIIIGPTTNKIITTTITPITYRYINALIC